MFIKIHNLESKKDMYINLDHITSIELFQNTYIFTDIHKNKIMALNTLELANRIENYLLIR